MFGTITFDSTFSTLKLLEVDILNVIFKSKYKGFNNI